MEKERETNSKNLLTVDQKYKDQIYKFVIGLAEERDITLYESWIYFNNGFNLAEYEGALDMQEYLKAKYAETNIQEAVLERTLYPKRKRLTPLIFVRKITALWGLYIIVASTIILTKWAF